MRTIRLLQKNVALLLAILFAGSANAQIHRVNNNELLSKDFSTVQAAINAANEGDTIYIEGSATKYGSTSYSSSTSIVLNKRLVLIGPGYFLEGASGNEGLQYNPHTAHIQALRITSAASGSVIAGLQLTLITNGNNNASGFNVENLTITRCLFDQYIFYRYSTLSSGTEMKNMTFTKNYILGNNYPTTIDWSVKDSRFENNIFGDRFVMNHTDNFGNVVRNNIFRYGLDIYSGYFANNILYSRSGNPSNIFSNVVLKNNLGIGTNLNGFTGYVEANDNVEGLSAGDVFEGGASEDGKFRLKAGSPAIGAGLTVGSVTNPDAGAFGGTDPYVLSGIPPIPAIYGFEVPASIPSGAATMQIKFSTRDHK